MHPPEVGCLQANSWICGSYFTTYGHTILASLGQHITLTAVSVGLGFVISLPIAAAARRSRLARGGILSLANILYTVPSLALFALLVPLTGLTATTVVVGLTLYTPVVLVRNILVGLDGVPDDVRESARGMGYGPVRLFWRVDLPLALPAIFAGLRVATVSTVALVTVGAVINEGGLGNLLFDATRSDFKVEALTAAGLCVALAIVADLVLLVLERLATPWRRRLG